MFKCHVHSFVVLQYHELDGITKEKKSERKNRHDVIGNIADLNLVSRKNVRHHTRKALLKKFNVVFSENNQLHRRGLLNFSQFSSTKAKATRAFIFKKTNKKGYKAIL